MTMIGKKVTELMSLLWEKRNLRVDKIYIGCGGNDEGACRQMTLAWIEGRVRDLVLGRPREDLL